ncbi:MFS transporter [Candidatus Fermentibacterales bacterium]|nr:MFS transporter [Candidatus Fermentibacterales bacterium]
MTGTRSAAPESPRPGAPTARAGRLRFLFRALSYPNYRLYFAGQSVSLIGTWMQRVAMGWLMYRLTNSAFVLGLVGFSGQIPSLLLLPLTGVLADRFDRKRIMVFCEVLAMIQAAVLAWLVLSGVITVFLAVVLAFTLGTIFAFEAPARQSLVYQVVRRKEDLAGAIALNSASFNSARLVGPSIAGLLVAAVGEGWAFLINSVTFLAVIWALLAMRLDPAARDEQRSVLEGSFMERVANGFRYAFRDPAIRAVLLLLSFISLVGFPFIVLMPVFAGAILKGGPDTLGFLMGAMGVGALSGALFVASRSHPVHVWKLIPLGAILLGSGTFLFALSRSLPLSLVLLVPTGFGMMLLMASCNTVLQSIVHDSTRGRLMGLYTMAVMGIMPFGSLLAGCVASFISAPAMLLFGGSCCVLAGLLFARRSDLRFGAMRKLTRAVPVPPADIRAQ